MQLNAPPASVHYSSSNHHRLVLVWFG